MTTVRSFASHGVIHFNLHKHRIIFSQQPSRVVVINFAESVVRTDESGSEWESAVTKKGEETRVKQLLDKAGIRHLNPCFPNSLVESSANQALHVMLCNLRL
jgi:hypothetical protein